jgi:hypothetical protein
MNISYLPKNSKIYTKKGLINIEELVKNDEILTTNGYKKVIKVLSYGIKPIYTITTSISKFNCSTDQNLMIINNNENISIKAKDLKLNNKLILTRKYIEGTDNIILPTIDFINRKDRLMMPEFTNDIAWFFGYLYFGAVNLKTPNFKIFCKDYKQLKKICKIIKKFGENIILITTVDNINNNYMIEINASNFIDYIMKYLKSNTIPYFINETTYENRISYLAGIIDGSKNNYNNIIKIICNNETFLKDLKNLLYSCGIECIINNNYLAILETSSLEQIKKNKLLDSSILIDSVNTSNTFTINNFLCCYADFIDIKHSFDDDAYQLEIEDNSNFFCEGYLIS